MCEKNRQFITVNTRVDIPYKRIADLLVGAFEGGCNYWIETADAVKPPVVVFQYEPGHSFPRYDYPLNEGGGVDCVDEDGKTHRLDLPSIMKGLQLMSEKYPQHFTDFINENDDAITSDVFVQLCLFGDVVYG